MRPRRRPTPSALVSVGLHLVLMVVVWQAVQLPAVFDRMLVVDRSARPARERVDFVRVTPPAESAGRPAATVPRSVAAPSRPALAPPVVVPLAAPTAVPSEIPPPASAPASADRPEPTGPLRGGSGPTRGAQPTFGDPRVWPGDPEFIYAPKTDKERLDSALVTTLRRYQDSVAAHAYQPNKFDRGDWTFERNGQKYGIDQQFIRLGKFSIPTALLAMLALNQMQGNPIAAERYRSAAYMRADILYHAQAAMNEEEFRKAVKAIRDRKEREHRAGSRPAPRPQGPLVSPGERPPE